MTMKALMLFTAIYMFLKNFLNSKIRLTILTKRWCVQIPTFQLPPACSTSPIEIIQCVQEGLQITAARQED
jgi:hypothetical protein